MRESEPATDLQKVVEDFLESIRQHRSKAVYQRYSNSMELLMSYLAVKLLDPDAPGRDESPAGTLEELTPELIRAYTGEFLMERISGDRRSLKRHLTALRSFVEFLLDKKLLEKKKGRELSVVIRGAVASLKYFDAPFTGLDESSGVRLYRVLRRTPEKNLVIEDIMSGKRFEDVRVTNGDDCLPNEGDVCLLNLKSIPTGWEGACLGIMDADVQPEFHYKEGPDNEHHLPLGEFKHADLKHGFDENSDEDYESIEDFEDYPDMYLDCDPGCELDDADFDDPDDNYDFEDFPLSAEEALDELSVEDRYARRKVIAAVLEGYDEVRDELMDWLADDSYRDVPFPGTGEAPANAARIISEVGDIKALNRLLDVLGDTDPLGEEAPLAIARLGPKAFACLSAVLDEKKIRPERETAVLRSLGYMAARHPCMRKAVLKKITAYILDNGPLSETALDVLAQIRGVESLRKLRTACKSGGLDLEKFGYTWDLLADRVNSPNWGESVSEAFIPLLQLYPSDEDLEDLYASIEDTMDIPDEEDLAELERLDEEMDKDMNKRPEKETKNNSNGIHDDLKEINGLFKGQVSEMESKKTTSDKGGGKVIPFPPNNGANKKDPEQ